MDPLYEDALYDATRTGGLGEKEALEYIGIDEATIETGEYDPADIPALGAAIADDAYDEALMPAEDLDSYLDQLLEEPGSIIEAWDVDVQVPFEHLQSGIRAKRDEYTIRTLAALEHDLDQDTIDTALDHLVSQDEYDPKSTSDQGKLGLVLGTYIRTIDELASDDTIIDDAYDRIAESTEASAAAAANQPPTAAPKHVRNNVFHGGEDGPVESIDIRLRNMVGAGKCHKIEDGHDRALLGEEPTRNGTVVTIDDEPLGFVKYDGDTSMIGLKDVTSEDGRQVLQRGMAYRISYTMQNEIDSTRAETTIEQYDDWERTEISRMELRPLRFVGASHAYSIREIRDQIEDRITTFDHD